MFSALLHDSGMPDDVTSCPGWLFIMKLPKGNAFKLRKDFVRDHSFRKLKYATLFHTVDQFAGQTSVENDRAPLSPTSFSSWAQFAARLYCTH